jgi:predicted alpha/beta-hydrolase family hydrolase
VSERTLQIEVPGAGFVTAIETAAAAGPIGWTFVYAPGAGSNVHDPFGVFACRALAERGVRGVRFQFPYQEAKRRSPDRPPTLEAAWRAVIDAVRDDSRLVVGGRSMGGRIASQVIAKDVAGDALALFAYPLHPPGKPEQRRDAHLQSIAVPAFFCSGTNDAFAAPEELREAAALVPNATVHLLEGADHGFAVRKSTGRTREDVYREAVDAMWVWLSQT